MNITPELLAAYADGELSGEQALAVEAEIAGNADLQAELAAHRALRLRLAAHFAPIAEKPVPERLRQAVTDVGGSNVIELVTPPRPRRAPTLPPRWMRIAGPALAASLVLVLLAIGSRPSGSYAAGELADALDTQLVATQKADAPVRVLLSFRDAKGEYCRGFSSAARSGIACRNEHGWRLRKLLGGGSGTSTEYRQAGSADMAVMASIQEMASGPALDAAEEQEAARRHWRNP
jgi:hypothetical protein